ncbi:MAG: alginate lyase family protein [Luteimonas sp.]
MRKRSVSVSILAAAIGLGSAAVLAQSVPIHPAVTNGGIWISASELAGKPTSGAAWTALRRAADRLSGNANLANQDSQHDTDTLAAALVYARTGDTSYRNRARTAIMSAPESENGGRTLALGRNLSGYIIAADLIDLQSLSASDDQRFRNWLSAVRRESLDGRSLIQTCEIRPNNWGTHACASRAAAAVYLGDNADLQRTASVFRGWLGDRASYAGFTYSELDWQCDSNAPVGINPRGCTKEGHSIDGVLPDDQRRGGEFRWPPPQENYAWGGLQGAMVNAVILERAGFDAFSWSDNALLRAVTWLYEVNDFPAEGNDTWLPWLANFAYGGDFATTPAQTGTNMGFTDWTHAP